MALGRRRAERQEELFVPQDRLPRSEGHVFYRRLNELLAEAGFDRFVEDLCRAHYAAEGRGRPSIPPGVYFRMLLVGSRGSAASAGSPGVAMTASACGNSSACR